MPTVPIARAPGTALRPLDAGQITARATPDAFGAGIGEGISNVAQAAHNIYRKERERINEAAILEADTADAQADLAARNQLAQARGKDAGFLIGQLEEAAAKRHQEMEQKLANPVQREAFRRRAVGRLQDFRAWGSGHVAREAEAYDNQVADAAIQTGMERVRSSRNDWNQAADELVQTIGTYRAHAERRGVPPEARALRESQIMSGGVRGVIEGLVNDKNDRAARRLFDLYGQRLTEDDKVAVGKLLEIAGRDGDAQRLVDEWMKGGMQVGDLEKRLTETPQLQQDTKLRDEVRARALQAIDLRDTARRADEHDAYAKAYAVIQDPTRGYADIPAELKVRMANRPDLDQHLRALSAKAERVTQTDRATYYGLQNEAATNPAAFVKRDLMEFATRLSDGDFKEMVKLQAEAKQGKGEQFDWLVSREDLVNQALAEMNIDPRTHWNQNGKIINNPQSVAFRAAIDRDAMSAARAAGRKTPNRDDVQDAIGAAMKRKVRLNVWGTDPERVASTVTADEKGTAYVPLEQIPGAQAQAIRTLITNAGGIPTDERVMRAMAARVLEDRDLLDQIIRER